MASDSRALVEVQRVADINEGGALPAGQSTPLQTRVIVLKPSGLTMFLPIVFTVWKHLQDWMNVHKYNATMLQSTYVYSSNLQF